MVKLRPRSQQFTILALRAATDPILIPGITPINAIHLTELRTALNDAYLAVGRTPPTYIGPTAVARLIIKTIQLNELRSSVRALQ